MHETEAVRAETLCRRYAAALETGDLAAILANFTEDATATSPLSGRQPARDFYAYVLRATGERRMTVRTIFAGIADPTRAALHMAYTRSVAGGPPTTIECVDIFRLTPDLLKIADVTIIYDTAPVRAEFDRPGAQRQAD